MQTSTNPQPEQRQKPLQMDSITSSQVPMPSSAPAGPLFYHTQPSTSTAMYHHPNTASHPPPYCPPPLPCHPTAAAGPLHVQMQTQMNHLSLQHQQHVAAQHPDPNLRFPFRPTIFQQNQHQVRPIHGGIAGPSHQQQHQGPSSQFVSQNEALHRGVPAPPGPLKHFQSTHMQQWIQERHNLYGDSGIQTMANTPMPSVMSGFSGISLPDDGCGSSIMSGSNPTEQNNRHLSEEQRLRFGQLLSCGGGADQQMDREAFAQAFPEVIALLGDKDEEVVVEAVKLVRRYAKCEAAQPHAASAMKNPDLILALLRVISSNYQKQEIVKRAMCALFHISIRADTLQLLNQVVDISKGELIFHLIRKIGSVDTYENIYALLILHSLVQSCSGSLARDCARELGALEAIVRVLNAGGSNDKAVNIAVDCARYIFYKNDRQKMRFLELGGETRLLNLLRTSHSEKLLHMTTIALKSLTDGAHEETARRIVAQGGIQALSLRLDHASDRLVIASLECILALSHVCAEYIELDVRDTLGRVLQLLGSANYHMVKLCLAIIFNMAARNKQNKEFLFDQGAIGSVVRVMDVFNNCVQQHLNSLQLEDINEVALTALRNLSVRFDRAELALQQVVQTSTAVQHYLTAVASMRPKLLKQALMILKQASHSRPNLAYFRDARYTINGETLNIVSAVAKAVSVAHSESLTNPTGEVEGVKLEDILWPGMATLLNMCADEYLVAQILDLKNMERPENQRINPLDILKRSTSEDVCKCALGLIAELISRDPAIAGALLEDKTSVTLFQSLMHSASDITATHASHILQTLQKVQRETGQMGDDFYCWLPEMSSDPFASMFAQTTPEMPDDDPNSIMTMTYPSPFMEEHHQAPAASPASPMQQNIPFRE